MSAALAAIPLVLVILLMVGFRWPAARASTAGLVAALVLAWGPFREAFTGDVGVLAATAGSLAEAVFAATTILWIVVPALALHQLQVSSGALAVLQTTLTRLTGDPRVLVLVVAWFFALFMEGAAGFGTAAALAAPFLVAAGFRPAEAVVLTLVGHAAGVSFGAVGTPILPQMAVTAFSALELAQATSIYHALLAGGLAALVVGLAARSSVPGDRTRTVIPATVSAAFLFLVPYVGFAWLLGPELPTLAGALIGGVAFVPLVRRFRPLELETSPPDARVVWAAAPYLVVVGLVLTTRLTPGLAGWLSGVEVTWSLPGGFGGSFAPLYHPGSMVMGGLVVGWLTQGLPRLILTAALRRAVRQVGTVSVALVSMLGLSRIMVTGSMIEDLAAAVAGLAGIGWPLLAPLVGALGTFIAGSATASNILFTEFQVSTARALGMPALPLVGAQGFGAAAGNMIAPHNVIAAMAVVEEVGREGEVLRTTSWITAAYLAAGGVIALAGVTLIG